MLCFCVVAALDAKKDIILLVRTGRLAGCMSVCCSADR